MAATFPTSPVNGETAEVGGRYYTWNSTSGVWENTGAASTLISVGNLSITDTVTAVTANIGDVDVADKIAHTGDTDTAIRFPAADTVTVETAGSERVRVDSSGNVGIGDATPLDLLHLREDVNSALATQLLLQNEGSGNHAAGIAFQVSSSPETTGYAPKAAILFERTLPNGRGSMKFMIDNADDADPFSAGDEVMRINSSGHVTPGTNNTYDLGTASLRWRNIYTNDLHLSNGIGDYTIVEGEEDLFLYNNKSGKVFKFALIEVDPSEATPKIDDLGETDGN